MNMLFLSSGGAFFAVNNDTVKEQQSYLNPGGDCVTTRKQIVATVNVFWCY